MDEAADVSTEAMKEKSNEAVLEEAVDDLSGIQNVKSQDQPVQEKDASIQIVEELIKIEQERLKKAEKSLKDTLQQKEEAESELQQATEFMYSLSQRSQLNEEVTEPHILSILRDALNKLPTFSRTTVSDSTSSQVLPDPDELTLLRVIINAENERETFTEEKMSFAEKQKEQAQQQMLLAEHFRTAHSQANENESSANEAEKEMVKVWSAVEEMLRTEIESIEMEEENLKRMSKQKQEVEIQLKAAESYLFPLLKQQAELTFENKDDSTTSVSGLLRGPVSSKGHYSGKENFKVNDAASANLDYGGTTKSQFLLQKMKNYGSFLFAGFIFGCLLGLLLFVAALAVNYSENKSKKSLLRKNLYECTEETEIEEMSQPLMP